MRVRENEKAARESAASPQPLSVWIRRKLNQAAQFVNKAVEGIER
jgi:hypothetical protein